MLVINQALNGGIKRAKSNAVITPATIPPDTIKEPDNRAINESEMVSITKVKTDPPRLPPIGM